MKKILLSLAIMFSGFCANAQYEIDSTFNLNGSNEFTMWAGNITNGERVAYTANNDVIVAGRWLTDRLMVWKYNQNGQPDNSFGTNGYSYVTPVGGTNTWVRDLEIQADGKIVVLAQSEWLSWPNYDYTQAWITIARFLPDGTPDSTFDTDGVLVMDLMPGFEYMPICMALDANNNIFVGGWVLEYGSYDCPIGSGAWFIAKYLPSGALDLTFNSTGFIQSTSGALAQTYTTDTPMAIVHDVKPLDGGKLLAAGAFNAMDSTYFSIRLNANGTYDNTYGLNGISLTQINTFTIPSTELTYVKILDDESIVYHAQYVIAGAYNTPDTCDMYIYKKDNAGNTQTSFGNNGFLHFFNYANRTRLDVDNQDRLIYSWSEFLSPTSQPVFFRRYNANGTPDNSFGNGGVLITYPLLGEQYVTKSYLTAMKINPANDDITLVAWRTAPYAPNTFRVLNYSVNPSSGQSIEDVAGRDDISIYPNPNSGKFTVHARQHASYRIYNCLGKSIHAGTLHTAHRQQLY